MNKILTPDSHTQAALAKAATLMDEIVAAPGQTSVHRSNMRRIETALSTTSFALGDFIVDYFRKKFQPPAVPSLSAGEATTTPYKCAGCGRTFDNPKAFQGHGQSRCLKRHNK